MLKNIYIKNIVLIDEIKIDINSGLNVFTGETGAGKSILLGHQMNDLHENFFLRMSRGSGLKGLTSLGKNSEFSNKKL